MYATPSTAEGGGALGGQRIGEKDMEEYLLGKKRVDEVLKQGDSVSNSPQPAIIAAKPLFPFPDRRRTRAIHRCPKCQHCTRYRCQSPRGSPTCDQASGTTCLSSNDEQSRTEEAGQGDQGEEGGYKRGAQGKKAQGERGEIYFQTVIKSDANSDLD